MAKISVRDGGTWIDLQASTVSAYCSICSIAFRRAVAGFDGAAFGDFFGVGLVLRRQVERAQVRMAFAVGHLL